MNNSPKKTLKNLICSFPIYLYCLSLVCPTAQAQWKTEASNTDAGFRGLCVVDDKVVWAGGSRGTFIRTTNGGEQWQMGKVSGAEELDFRDVEAFDGESAWLLSIGEGTKSRIYKTTNGGKGWSLQYQNTKEKAFFDALAFWDGQTGIALSDPVEGRFLVITTQDGGTNWVEAAGSMPLALTNESAFAASGTCLVTHGKSNVWFATGGGIRARVFRSADRGRTWSVSETPMRAGTASAGIFSLAFRDDRHGVAIGGDYLKPGETGNNLAFTDDGGATWRLSKHFPSGFRSAVSWVQLSKDWLLVAVGTSGSDFARPGEPWRQLDAESYNALSFSRISSHSGWAAGANGRVARLVKLPEPF